MAAELSRSVGSSRGSWRSHLSGSFRELVPDPTDAFFSKVKDHDDEADLRLAAMQKLSRSPREFPGDISLTMNSARSLASQDSLKGSVRIDTGLEFLETNERILRDLRERMNRERIEMPKIEVRFENLSVEADAYVGRRALPSLLNVAGHTVEGMARSVGLPVSKKTVNKILRNVSGILKPSRMTLLLGPPGSGKTTLLKALAGIPDKNLRMAGRISYCGHELTEFVPQRTSAYVGEDDLHQGEMTVRETLDFSRQCLGPSFGSEMLTEIASKEGEGETRSNALANHILKIFGLDACADVLVGDEMRRGISGGEKKRVTIGEMLVGPARVLLLDEISNGLDTSTTFQIVKFLQQTAHLLDETILISLLQPQPETFNLFDDLILLSEGKIVYQGPCERVLEFFELMGFKCPDRKGIPDFLQEVTSKKDQEQYWSDRRQPYKFIPLDEFVQAFGSFDTGHQLKVDLGTAYDKSKTHASALAKDRYAMPGPSALKACFAREWLLMKRNSLLYIVKIFQIIFLAGLGVSIFPRTEMHHETIADGGKYFGALFYGVICVMANGISEIIFTIIRLPVHNKQRDKLFYPTWAFSLSFIILRIPVSLVESVIWVAISYYPTGFAPSAKRFLSQILAYFWIHQGANALFRFLAAFGRSLVAANSAGVLVLTILVAHSGFIISKSDIDPWWIWCHWLSPVMYALNSLTNNEFLDSRWIQRNNDINIDAPTVGIALLKSRGMFVNGYWFWISIGALVGFTMVYNIGFIVCMSYLSSVKSSRVLIVDEDEKKAKALFSVMPLKQIMKSSELGVTEPDITLKDFPSSVISQRRVVLPFKPLSLTFNHVNYYIDMPEEMKSLKGQKTRLQLLYNMSGAFKPGILTALVGVSGAGKTTLMDVLAGRKTGGYIEGSISISGYPKNQATFSRVSGYCEQNDIHSPYVTVYESLIYSAWLRLPPDVKLETQKLFVEEVMELIELDALRDALVGLPGVSGLSIEQRKRFTIAVELVANPSIMFMDEPTSGLDARSAAIVMRTVRNTVNTGRTVVCTIHQPSIDIFESFDDLLLMKLGGKLIYAGPLGKNSQNLINYFEAIPGISKLKEGQNPATWILQITTPSIEAQLNIDFSDIYDKSALYQINQSIIEELSTPPPSSEDLYFCDKHARTFAIQFTACFWKQYWSYWKNPSYNGVRFITTIAMALFFGSLFWNKGQQTSTQQDVLNLIGAVYCSIFFLGLTIGSTVQPVVAIERTVFYRERATGMYSALAYAFAQVAIETIYIAVQALLYSMICYSMMGFKWEAENIIMLLLFNFWNIFCGVVIYKPMMPKWWTWCYWISPVSWTIYGLIVSQLGDIERILLIPGQPNMTVKAFLKEVLGYEKSFLGYVAMAHLGFVIAFTIAFAFGIKKFNFQRR
ncbi:pleiotropic drug resistance protein 2-like isoform X2 [Wolffia australiana]